MKKYLCGLVLLLSFNSFAETLTVKKLIDGSSATCNSQEDVLKGSQQGGAYTVSIIGSKETKEQLLLKLKLDFLRCIESEKNIFRFTKASVNSSTSYNILTLENTLQEITVKIENPIIRIISDDKIIAQQALSNSSTEQINLVVNKFDILNNELLIDLEAQKSIFSASNRQLGSTESIYYGAFVIHLK